jgi:hypothetical protein
MRVGRDRATRGSIRGREAPPPSCLRQPPLPPQRSDSSEFQGSEGSESRVDGDTITNRNPT